MTDTPFPQQRLLSLDFFRGATMILLLGEGARLYSALIDASTEGSLLQGVALQFHHHPWNGLRFWDLVQPFFMFIVGVAMVFSLRARSQRGDTWAQSFRHIGTRCVVLFFFGVILHCGYSGRLVWELWNVLTQLSVTILIAFLIFNLSVHTQMGISLALLVLTEVLYRTFPAAGFDQPFVIGQNFGSWMDMALMGKLNGGGWVAINCIPTAAHTIWGVLAGKLLASSAEAREKLKLLVAAGMVGLLAGYGLDWLGLTPIIKRICTSSFVIVSGGWCLLALAASYWLIDIRGHTRAVRFFAIVGMNSIFIYLFTETVGKQWFTDFIGIFTNGFLNLIGTPAGAAGVSSALAVLALDWGLCAWLYDRKIFIRI